MNNVMKCFKNFNDSRICDMCSLVNSDVYNECKNIVEDKANKRKELARIESKCPYRMDAYDEYTHYYSCNKDGNGYGRFGEECHATLECKNILINRKEE